MTTAQNDRQEPLGDGSELRDFCGDWPWPWSDADIVMPEDNAKAHRARGCCGGVILLPQEQCSQCRRRLAVDEDEAHNHGVCSACWSEAAAEQELQR